MKHMAVVLLFMGMAVAQSAPKDEPLLTIHILEVAPIHKDVPYTEINGRGISQKTDGFNVIGMSGKIRYEMHCQVETALLTDGDIGLREFVDGEDQTLLVLV